MDRYTYLHRIEQLDPQTDHVEISQLSTCYEFPWDHLRGLEMGFRHVFPGKSPRRNQGTLEQAWARNAARCFEAKEVVFSSTAGSKHGPEKPPSRVVWHWSSQSTRLSGDFPGKTCRNSNIRLCIDIFFVRYLICNRHR